MELASQGFLLQYTPLQNCNSYQKRKNRVNETQDTQNNNIIQKKGAVITAQKILLFIVISPDIGNIQVDVVYLHVKRGYQFFCCLFRKSDIRSYTLFKVKNKFYNTTISSSIEIDDNNDVNQQPMIWQVQDRTRTYYDYTHCSTTRDCVVRNQIELTNNRKYVIKYIGKVHFGEDSRFGIQLDEFNIIIDCNNYVTAKRSPLLVCYKGNNCQRTGEWQSQ
ncbi:hypothetical protein RFI_40084 [Reticulomyxa filosa]|uniref:Uncharacterized protein n=1 Tax=Reticulomyxa filosa TaxID=46433 RepID=X6L7Q7_RETFI|nr:hypothetical protein RFI_40084 [Reticulomyxa filosa]|eukprot:ETN97445.1 hypothetical protein RFI_40084 [Reticulomyxa filosa]